MKGAPSQQGGSSGGFGGGGFPQWLGMASQYFPQFFGGMGGSSGGYPPPGGAGGYMPPAGGAGGYPPSQPGGGGIDYGGGTPQYSTPPPAPPAPPAPPPPTTGLLGGAPLAGGADGGSNTMGQYGLLSGMPTHSGWMPGYGGSRYGGGGQPGGIVPPQQQPVTGAMPPRGGYGLFGQFGQY